MLGRRAEPGFVALMSVLVLVAIALGVGVGLMLRAIGEGNLQLTTEASIRARQAATACSEEAVYQLKLDTAYAGNQTLTLSDGTTCRIGAITGTGNTNRTITTTSTVTGASSKVFVDIATVNPLTSVTTWQERTDF